MKWVTFDEVENPGLKRYEIDWSTYDERRYKEPVSGFRVYEAGFIHLVTNGGNDPNLRAFLINAYGIDLRLLNELSGYEFFDPERKTSVAKAWLDPDDGPFLLDVFRNRVYCVHRRGSRPWSGIKFLHPDAQPVASTPMQYKRPNRATEKALRDRLRSAMDLGETLTAMSGTPTPKYGYNWNIPRYVDELLQPNVDLHSPKVQETALALAACTPRRVDECIQQRARDTFETQYLTIRRK